MWERGVRLSNMWLTYPQDRDNFGKLRLNPDRWRGLERFSVEIILGPCFRGLPAGGAPTDQVVGGVTAHQPYNWYGPGERDPGAVALDDGPGPTAASRRENPSMRGTPA